MGKVVYFDKYVSFHGSTETTLDNILVRTNSYVKSYYKGEIPENEGNTIKGEFQEPWLINSENVDEFKGFLRYGDKVGLVNLYIQELEVKELMYQISNDMANGLYEDELKQIRNLKNKFKSLI